MSPPYHTSPILERISARADLITSSGRGLSATEAADLASVVKAQTLRIAHLTAEVDRISASKSAGHRRPVRDAVQQRLLDTLRRNGGRLDTATVRGVAEIIGARKSTVGEVLKSLVADGLVRKADGALLLVARGAR